jgi:hypothetical protein
MATFTQRMIGAARLDAATYEEVEADSRANGQAVAVVVLSAVAAGIGGAGAAGLKGAVFGLVSALVGWYIWALLTWFIGTRILPEPQTQADVGQLLRTTGFSASPGILRVFGFVPLLGGLIAFVTGIWMLASMVVAVRQALDYRGTGRAVGVCLIGFLVYLLITVFLLLPFGLGGLGHGVR